MEALFEEGKRLKKDGQFLDAARKFEQVQRLDPGIGTLLHLAESYERGGLLASALAKRPPRSYDSARCKSVPIPGSSL